MVAVLEGEAGVLIAVAAKVGGSVSGTVVAAAAKLSSSDVVGVVASRSVAAYPRPPTAAKLAGALRGAARANNAVASRDPAAFWG